MPAQRMPFFWLLALALAAGLGLPIPGWAWLALATAGLALSLVNPFKYLYLRWLALIVLSAGAATLLRPANPAALSVPHGTALSVKGFWLDVPTLSQRQRTVQGPWHSTAGSRLWVYARARPGSLPAPGVPHSLTGEFTPAQAVQPQGWRSYLLAAGYAGTLYAAAAPDSAQGSTPGVTAWLASLRHRLGLALTQPMPAWPQAQAMARLLLLSQRGLDAQTRQNLSTAGLAHVMALSGMHLSLVLLLLGGVAQAVGLPLRGWRALAVLALLGLYVTLAGAPPSALRALLMAAYALGALALHRPARVMQGLGLSACVLLLAQPRLVHHLGFQLSYLAVLGLAWLYPVLNQGISRLTSSKYINTQTAHYQHFIMSIIKFVLQTSAATLAATLFTLPVVLYHFQTLPLYTLLANVLAAPLGTGALALGVLTLLLGWVPGLGWLLGAGTAGCLATLAALAQWVAGLPGAALPAALSAPAAWALMVGVCLLTAWLNHLVKPRPTLPPLL